MLGSSFLPTVITFNVTKRVMFSTYQLFRWLPDRAQFFATETAIAAASTVAVTSAIILLDPLGAGLSVIFITCEVCDPNRIGNSPGK
jgi:hypothetical protein